jgi:hypothetical protein
MDTIKIASKGETLLIVEDDVLTAMGIPELFISGQSLRARSKETGAMGSLPKPYRTADMVLAVDYLFARPHKGLEPDAA